MFWDDLVRRWRKEARVNSPESLRAIGGHVAVLPAPRRARQSRPLLLVLAILALLLLLVIRSGTLDVKTNTTEPTPPASIVRSA
jgi:hypothetical protein